MLWAELLRNEGWTSVGIPDFPFLQDILIWSGTSEASNGVDVEALSAGYVNRRPLRNVKAARGFTFTFTFIFSYIFRAWYLTHSLPAI